MTTITIDIADLKLVNWLAKKAVPLLKLKTDKKIALQSIKYMRKVIKVIKSWEGK